MSEKQRDLCWYCKHLELDTGEQDWSEVTVGYSGHIRCRKEHWRVNFARGRQPDLFECVQEAATCSDFEARDDAL